ncbi:TetR/AcrR family transcriptional regulator [Microbacterium sp. ARD32]|uniref:TetR/AcrR family transcriptional regulator n=1 Tax=Microbacterium sp. ARD32 TaxID=2962577 RepID=UPI002881A607|nr:TetR/AcrR family transcriptional regulator [Microbacterium sp. ARD32]MDT0157267.1 TetR/AcrR family transcriptional regulator [Microbacterium sp. ARD32]
MFSSELTPKAEQTRARIRDAAMRSFMQRGYADTTIREIAAQAGVSVGNAYYYFPSKTHLVQELYQQVQRDHARAAVPKLAEGTGLIDRLRIVFETGLDTLEPYRRVAPGFLAAMIAPDSPINPLARESTAAREQTRSLFQRAVAGAEHRLPEDIAERLPDALFVAFLALVMRWTYDADDQERTRRLLSTALRLLATALPFVRLPGVRNVTRDLLEQIGEVRA